MKTFVKFLAVFAVAGMFASCNKDNKEPETAPVPDTPKEEVYQPVHNSSTVDLKTAKKYAYYNAPTSSPAASVQVLYDQKAPYTQPIVVKYTYANGDTYTYTVPADFGLWRNEAGRFRVIYDDKGTVWMQGQTKAGKFHELIFYGDPQFNGKKIKPNSYRNLPAGEIKYRK